MPDHQGNQRIHAVSGFRRRHPREVSITVNRRTGFLAPLAGNTRPRRVVLCEGVQNSLHAAAKTMRFASYSRNASSNRTQHVVFRRTRTPSPYRRHKRPSPRPELMPPHRRGLPTPHRAHAGRGRLARPRRAADGGRPAASGQRPAASGRGQERKRPARGPCLQGSAERHQDRAWKKSEGHPDRPLCSSGRGLWLKWHLAAASPRGGHPTPPPTPLTTTPLGRGATNNTVPLSLLWSAPGIGTEGDASRLLCFVAAPPTPSARWCLNPATKSPPSIGACNVRYFTVSIAPHSQCKPSDY
jgi:hypothetical protein